MNHVRRTPFPFPKHTPVSRLQQGTLRGFQYQRACLQGVKSTGVFTPPPRTNAPDDVLVDEGGDRGDLPPDLAIGFLVEGVQPHLLHGIQPAVHPVSNL